MSGPFGSSQLMFSSGGGAAAAAQEQSLRFNDDDSAYLSIDFPATTNRKLWTWSGWVKRGSLGSHQNLFACSSATNNGTFVRLNSDDGFQLYHYDSGTASFNKKTSAKLRDVSAWYHLVAIYDSDQGTGEDRIKLYINGDRVTDWQVSTNPSSGKESDINLTARTHWIGTNYNGSELFDGYMAEVNFVDGTAYDPTYFGETDANGQWVPKTDLSGLTYGTNGFYLPFTNDYTVEGFNTVTYRGTGADQYIGGTGFEPDLVWIKCRSTATTAHNLYDSVRGATKYLQSHSTSAEGTLATSLKSFDTDGFTVGSWSEANSSGRTFVAWNWDMGTGSAASNTDGSITSSVKANPTYGQSIVSYTGTGASATVGHGLSSAPEALIVKARNNTTAWRIWWTGFTGTERLQFDTSAKATTGTSWDGTVPAASVFSLGADSNTNNSGTDYVAYAFHSVAGYSDFGSYTGTGASGNKITTGFEPAFVMIKNTTTAGYWWMMKDNTRDPSNPNNLELYANVSDAEYTASGYDLDFDSDGFTIDATATAINGSGETYVYMAFADKREAAFWLDQSGNNNDWTNNNMQESDISLDNPTNNFATLGPVVKSVRSEGNLRSSKLDTNYNTAVSSIAVKSGKWYSECRVTLDAIYPVLGIADVSSNTINDTSKYMGEDSLSYGYFSTTWYFNNSSAGAHGLSISSGDILGVALDLDSAQNTLKIYVNGVLGSTLNINDPVEGYVVGSMGSSFSGAVADWNFGQDSSFHGLEVAQGNTDENGYGDFYYEPPSEHLALCTQNLPDPAIADGTEHFNTVLYTGNGSTQSITGVGFQPDFVWGKGRSFTQNHALYDTIRGATKRIVTNSTAAENTETGGVTSFDTDGFSVGNSSSTNSSGNTFVAWNWKADNTSGTSNTDGSITSTVSANTTAGFSVVGYTGNLTAGATIGHGLSSSPDMIIVKNRDAASNWRVYHSALGATQYASLNATDAFASATSVWNDTEPTSSVFTVGASSTTNPSGSNLLAYCFHSVEGYSKFGSYTGNGSSNGTFVYTGFRPAFVIIKRSNSTGNWYIHDNMREGYNGANDRLQADQSDAEYTQNNVDILSNGFKLITSATGFNGSGSTYVYMAFAESPFKYSSAR